MFVPVSCTDCGKPFQVPESALGQRAACPWCRAVVLALPVSAPAPRAPQPPPAPPKAEAPPAEAPLSLDDDAPPPDRPRRWLITVLVAGLIVLAGMALTVLYRGYGAGRVSEWGWTEFAPPDGSFGVALPDDPVEEDVPANPEGSVTGGKRYVVRGRYSKTAVWVAYADLAPALVAKLPADKDRVITAGVLRVERDREVSRLKATVTKEAEVRVGSAWGVELHMDTPEGGAVERLVLAGSGPHPRLYAYGAEGKNLTPKSPACTKLFNTFRATE
ncbi:hypothetical protein FTUN_3383 [Frigoriglobus tundricola]|uniref:Uncharacterized protein n=2 Tax=Frigoriglobus tundricola TaxID=2774151 RepID=A0A6M5YP35_9BACT|nr:hypothetical protein FTUN_3383 [Frigoriglobus tundricola]